MILVIAEHHDGRLKPISFEMIAFAQRLRRDFGHSVAAVVLGTNLTGIAEQFQTKKIDKLILVDHPGLADYNPSSWVQVMKPLIEQENPFIVIAGHTTEGMDFAPRLAVVLRRPLIAGCVDFEKQGERLILTR